MGDELQRDTPFDMIITIRFDESDGTPMVNIGDHDPYSASSVLRHVASFLEELFPIPLIEGTQGVMLGPVEDDDLDI